MSQSNITSTLCLVTIQRLISGLFRGIVVPVQIAERSCRPAGPFVFSLFVGIYITCCYISCCEIRFCRRELDDVSWLEIFPVTSNVTCISDASISLFQFRYDIDTISRKYRDIDIDIDISYVSKMHAFCRLN